MVNAVSPAVDPVRRFMSAKARVPVSSSRESSAHTSMRLEVCRTMRIVVTSDAGVPGTHRYAPLPGRGDQVVCVDDLSTGRLRDVLWPVDPAGLEIVHAEASRGRQSVSGAVDGVAFLAGLAVPPCYQAV